MRSAVEAGQGQSQATPPPDSMPPITSPNSDDVPPSVQPPPAAPPVVDFAGAVAAVCACVKVCCDALPGRIAEEIERRLVTSRGIAVRPAPTCAQPVSSHDVDDQVLQFPLPSSDGDGVRRVILKRVARQSMVLKGLNWQFAVDKSVQRPADPGDQVVVHVLVNGSPVGSAFQGDDMPTGGLRTRAAYHETRRPPAPGGVDQLAPAQIYVREGDTVEIIAERVTPPVNQERIDYLISARWKGWEWTPTIDAPGATGVGGF